MRGTTWIAAPMPRVPVELTSKKKGEFIQDKEAVHLSIGQYFYTPQEIQKLANDPEYLLNYRKGIEYAINEGFAIFYKSSEASEMVHKYMVAEMKRRLKNDPVLASRLQVCYSHLVESSLWKHHSHFRRRLTPGHGYLEALIEPNVLI